MPKRNEVHHGVLQCATMAAATKTVRMVEHVSQTGVTVLQAIAANIVKSVRHQTKNAAKNVRMVEHVRMKSVNVLQAIVVNIVKSVRHQTKNAAKNVSMVELVRMKSVNVLQALAANIVKRLKTVHHKTVPVPVSH